jgi:xylan 1,4-beta-xylosidase
MKKQKVQIRVDAGKVVGELKHSWRYIGYDECNYTHAPEGETLIAKFGGLEDAPYYFRTHHLLCTGNCHGTYKWGSTNVYREDEAGKVHYDWTVLDNILDIYLCNNSKPFFELGFMPLDLVDPRFMPDGDGWNKMGDYKHHGWASPPKDYQKWYDLVHNIVEHCVARYGETEVLAWYWELWNEPDIFYWNGTVEEFCKLFDYTEAAVHAALGGARLGGPATTGPKEDSDSRHFLAFFLNHCANGVNYLTGKRGTRLDYITFHVKGGGFPFKIDATKATPSVKSFVEQVKVGLETIKNYGYAGLEVVLSEADPDGWAAGGIYDNRNMNFRNTEYYASYVASSYHNLKRIARAAGMDVRPLAWAFMFVAERCFEGTRTFVTQGIDKAVFNLFKLYAKLGTRELSFASSHKKEVLGYADDFGTGEDPEVSGMATLKDDGTVQIFVYSHHDDWDIDQDFEINVDIGNLNLGKTAKVRHYRVDASHSNPYPEWLRQGKPLYPAKQQYEAIKSRDGLEMLEPDQEIQVNDGRANLVFSMPVHAVTLLEITVEK